MTRPRILATVAVGGFALSLLPVEAADAAPATSGILHRKVCRFEAQGESLRIRVAAASGPNTRNINEVALRATDNDESGKYRNGDVRIRMVRLIIRDRSGDKTLDQKVAPSSPGSFDVQPAGNQAGKVTVRVRWRTHDTTVTKGCSVEIP